MNRPTITQARKLCGELKARAVIIIALYEEDCGGASYGETRLECSQAGRTLDHIITGIGSGRIPTGGEDEPRLPAERRRSL